MYDPEIGTGDSVSGFGPEVISVSDEPAAPSTEDEFAVSSAATVAVSPYPRRSSSLPSARCCSDGVIFDTLSEHKQR